jgi:hypothetical protein
LRAAAAQAAVKPFLFGLALNTITFMGKILLFSLPSRRFENLREGGF